MKLPKLLECVRRLGKAHARTDTLTSSVSSGPPFTIFPYMGRTPMPSPPPASEKPEPKPFIPVKGMKGYSERGEPDGWDTAMGEVYGYRWWTLNIPAALAGMRETWAMYGGQDRSCYTSYLQGANHQPWMSQRMEARCTASKNRPWNAYGYGQSFSLYPEAETRLIHQPPETREACGCGFWAYFNKDLQVGTVIGNAAGVSPSVDFSGEYASIPIFGVIKGTGRVIIGDKGFRSQYAQIMGLCVPDIAVAQLGFWLGPSRYGDSRAPWEPGELPNADVSASEHTFRVAAVETRLINCYPGVKIFSSQELLTRYFPPDKNYA